MANWEFFSCLLLSSCNPRLFRYNLRLLRILTTSVFFGAPPFFRRDKGFHCIRLSLHQIAAIVFLIRCTSVRYRSVGNFRNFFLALLPFRIRAIKVRGPTSRFYHLLPMRMLKEIYASITNVVSRHPMYFLILPRLPSRTICTPLLNVYHKWFGYLIRYCYYWVIHRYS